MLELIQSDVFRLQLPQAVVDVRSSAPLTPGSTVTVEVKGGGPNAKLDDLSGCAAAPDTPRQGATPPQQVLAGKTPIGEAVVLSRAPGPPTTPARAAATSALSEAPSIVPTRQPRRATTAAASDARACGG